VVFENLRRGIFVQKNPVVLAAGVESGRVRLQGLSGFSHENLGSVASFVCR